MNNKKQDWRTADSKNNAQANRSGETEKPINGKKPLVTDSTLKNASSSRQTDLDRGLSSGNKGSRR